MLWLFHWNSVEVHSDSVEIVDVSLSLWLAIFGNFAPLEWNYSFENLKQSTKVKTKGISAVHNCISSTFYSISKKSSQYEKIAQSLIKHNRTYQENCPKNELIRCCFERLFWVLPLQLLASFARHFLHLLTILGWFSE